jgi:hypothetical protein
MAAHDPVERVLSIRGMRMMDRRSREGEGIQELAEGHPVHAALLAAFAERLAPLGGVARVVEI